MFQKLTVRNFLAITTGLAVACWLVFIRFDHAIEFPVSKNATNSLVVKQGTQVILKTRIHSGYKSQLDVKSDITQLKTLSDGLPVKKSEFFENESKMRITYKVNILQKIQLHFGMEESVLFSK